MNKWARYRKIEIVDVMFFERPENPARPTYPIELAPCGCEPQDGYTCEQHRRSPSYSYGVRAVDRWVWIRPGEYLVQFSNGQFMTVSPEELGEHFEVAASPPRTERQTKGPDGDA